MRFIGLKKIYESEELRDTPYLTRAWIGRLYLHIFHRGDADPDPHDHPRDFWTFPLTSYVEEVTVRDWVDVGVLGHATYPQVVQAFRLHYRPAEYTHRVLGRLSGFRDRPPGSFEDAPDYWEYEPEIGPGKIVTIVWWRTKRYKREWGFLKNRDGKWCWVSWRDYILAGGKHGPCEDEDG